MTLQDRLSQVRLLALDHDGVLTDNKVYVSASGEEMCRYSRADGIGIARLKALGVRVVVITSEPQYTAGHRSICDVRCAKLGLEILHADKTSKLDILQGLVNYVCHISFDETAYIGNDVNDVECLRAVGVPIVPADAEELLGRALHGTDIEVAVLTRNGGDGVVREACEWIADAIEQHKPRVAEALG